MSPLPSQIWWLSPLTSGAASVAQDDARMRAAVLADRVIEVRHHLPMRAVRNLGHFENSSRQLVPVSLLGLQNLLEGHCTTMIGWSDGERRGDCDHGRHVLSIDEIRSLFMNYDTRGF